MAAVQEISRIHRQAEQQDDEHLSGTVERNQNLGDGGW